MNLETFRRIIFGIVILSWFLFMGLFILRKKTPQTSVKSGDRGWLIGLWMQALAFASVWGFPRPFSRPLFPMPAPADVGIELAAVLLAAASIWLTLEAIRALGRQWAYQARLVEGHKLITGGPYGLMRNPIYAGLLGMLIATGITYSVWPALFAAVAMTVWGTWIRIRTEERLLRSAFPAEYAAYARRVPALVPHPWRRHW